MQPVVQEYRKIFSEDMLTNTNLLREGHRKIKEKMFKFMPIEKAILSMTVRHLPSPLEGHPRKIDSLAVDFRTKVQSYLPCRNAIIQCNEEEPIVVYVTKMQPFSSRIYNVASRTNE